jgi:cytochrome c553
MFNYKGFIFFFVCCFLLGLAPSKAKTVKKPFSRIIKDCALCHDTDGNASAHKNWPKLAGQNLNYLLKQLHDFNPKRDPRHGRYNPIMSTLVASLSESEKIKIASYYAGLQGNIDTAATNSLSLGQRLYRGGDFNKGIPACLACHDPAGLGNPPAGFPRLSGQHAAYIESQLKAFRDGSRHNDKYQIMEIISQKMSDIEIQALANYISGLYF